MFPVSDLNMYEFLIIHWIIDQLIREITDGFIEPTDRKFMILHNKINQDAEMI